ncbi:hypothetical protein ABZ848_14935 [Streptomyces sp. NPDC047081]|uniref:hypothetical protein n=1 Tax=Streptomyces sp. NPDC047081 TaxID=3154706 RepID=UPI00341012E4
MPARADRARRHLVAAILAALTALTLAGCQDGTGIRDEGPATSHAVHAPAVTLVHGDRDAKRPSGLQPDGLETR